MSQPIRGQDILFCDRAEKHKHLVEDVEILLPVKLRRIPFSGFRKVEHVKVYAGRWTDDAL